ncbi:hypothetical protein SKAU_G00380980 [Synaphobranchus kaupii]|uniref:Uncharacterized protein n=1 Tax=Synaphobranchus kaupii TaxID=118154 RepID=A0A9Q1EDL9_SYNKA|nr:hypothetical protein SKAU_G00380980 [Synaphobranchus kaupii]
MKIDLNLKLVDVDVVQRPLAARPGSPTAAAAPTTTRLPRLGFRSGRRSGLNAVLSRESGPWCKYQRGSGSPPVSGASWRASKPGELVLSSSAAGDSPHGGGSERGRAAQCRALTVRQRKAADLPEAGRRGLTCPLSARRPDTPPAFRRGLNPRITGCQETPVLLQPRPVPPPLKPPDPPPNPSFPVLPRCRSPVRSDLGRAAPTAVTFV